MLQPRQPPRECLPRRCRCLPQEREGVRGRKRPLSPVRRVQLLLLPSAVPRLVRLLQLQPPRASWHACIHTSNSYVPSAPCGASLFLALTRGTRCGSNAISGACEVVSRVLLRTYVTNL